MPCGPGRRSASRSAADRSGRFFSVHTFPPSCGTATDLRGNRRQRPRTPGAPVRTFPCEDIPAPCRCAPLTRRCGHRGIHVRCGQSSYRRQEHNHQASPVSHGMASDESSERSSSCRYPNRGPSHHTLFRADEMSSPEEVADANAVSNEVRRGHNVISLGCRVQMVADPFTADNSSG